ncbi:hypothetical protein CEE39_03420 [bacterium (candidate division B38) B3_B38]|nr:MAG: hypothetical protein CEE39_03420 [bacterium (candidate division B38) B3_B38]
MRIGIIEMVKKMRCFPSARWLSLYLDDDLPPRKRRSLEEHLQKCPRCQSVLQDLGTIRQETRSLEKLSPPEGLWEAIQKRLKLSPQGQRRAYPWAIPLATWLRRGWVWKGALITSAVIVAVFTLLRFFPVWIPAEQGYYPFSPPLMAEVRQQLTSARSHYLEFIGELSLLANAEMERWDAAIAGAYRESLQGIDRNIKVCEEEMERFPLDPEIRGYLFNIYHEKLALLESIIEIGGGD